jgi:integrase
MPLTHTQIKNAQARAKQYKLFDGGGLYLLCRPNGGKLWQMKYRVDGREKTLSIGAFPTITLADARERREAAKRALAQGLDPSAEKQRAKAERRTANANTFGVIAREWHAQRAERWDAPYAAAVMRRMELDLLPDLDKVPIAQITAPVLLATLRKMEGRGALDLLRRTRQYATQIFAYAIATGRAERNVAADLKGVFKTRKVQNRSRFAEAELPAFLACLEDYQGEPITKLAWKLMLLTFVRTSELLHARWAEIDLDKAQWRIPAARMKMDEEHIVPLSPQALAVLADIRALSGGGPLLFPSVWTHAKPLSNNTLIGALYRMGYHSRATVHGVRGTASTILNEHGFRADVIERQLAHGERDGVRAAYNHAQYLSERREMMDWWGQYLEKAGLSATIAKPIKPPHKMAIHLSAHFVKAIN